MATQTNSNLSIGEYLIRRLQDYGIRDVFGIPGDYILSFYTMLEESPLRTIGCTREDCAGFAADAYARVNGMGALCVTYCVGGLSVCNSIAGAYAEKSPVVMITGSPGLRERIHNPLLHHMVRNLRTQYDVFEKLTVRRHRASRSAHRVQRDRSRAATCAATSGPSTSKSRATWSTCGPTPRRPTNSRNYAATPAHLPRRSMKP